MSWIELALGFAIGLVVGTAFFAGLRWTVERATRAGRPFRFLLGSFVVRALLVGAACVFVSTWSLWAFTGSALGFAAARRVLVGRVRRSLTWS